MCWTGRDVDRLSTAALWQAAIDQFGETGGNVEGLDKRGLTKLAQRVARLPAARMAPINGKAERGWICVKLALEEAELPETPAPSEPSPEGFCSICGSPLDKPIPPCADCQKRMPGGS